MRSKSRTCSWWANSRSRRSSPRWSRTMSGCLPPRSSCRHRSLPPPRKSGRRRRTALMMSMRSCSSAKPCTCPPSSCPRSSPSRLRSSPCCSGQRSSFRFRLQLCCRQGRLSSSRVSRQLRCRLPRWKARSPLQMKRPRGAGAALEEGREARCGSFFFPYPIRSRCRLFRIRNCYPCRPPRPASGSAPCR